MELEWLGNYRTFVEKLIQFGNAYVQTYNVEYDLKLSVNFSPAQMQTLEYILENEEKNRNMAELALRLGTTPSTFSKNVRKMMDKGLLEKYHTSTNRKDVIVRVSPEGKRIYEQYAQIAKQKLYQKIFAILDTVPPDEVDKFAQILALAADANQAIEEPVLVKIE